MNLHRVLLALAVLTCFCSTASADEVVPAPESVLFRPVHDVVTVEKNAWIFGGPGGNAIFKLKARTRVAAQAVSVDGRWWEIVFPNGDIGYAPTVSLVNKP